MTRRFPLRAALAAVLCAPFAHAGECETKLVDSNGVNGDNFGISVSLDGDVMVVGAGADDVGGVSLQGSATVFRRGATGWVEEAELASASGPALNQFGSSVAVSGDLIAVVARGEGTTTVYRWNGAQWAQEAVLTPGAGGSYRVAASGDVIVVGSPFAEVAGNAEQGVATVFRWSGASWEEEAVLTAQAGQASDQFGFSVAVQGDVVAVGAPFSDVGGELNEGAATVFRWSGTDWVGEATLTSRNGASDDEFGYSVAVDDGVVVVGARYDTVDGHDNRGSATVYRWDGAEWAEEQELVMSTGVFDDKFGTSVAIDGDTVVVGAMSDDEDGHPDKGSATVFRRDGAAWTEEVKLTSSDGNNFDFFGASTALQGETVVAGAYFFKAGAVYLYELGSDLPAAEVPRAGVPPNPLAFLPGVTSGPVVGATWDPVVDHTGFAKDAISDFVLVTGAPANLPLGPEGTLLCDVAAPPFLLATSAVPGAPFALAVPDDCSLVGFPLCAQAGSVAPDLSAHLANALDIVIGAD